MRALRRSFLLAVLALPNAAPLGAQGPAADPNDVGSINGIVRAFYDVINGPAGAPRQWRRDSTLYMDGAMFVSMDVREGRPVAARMTPEEFRRRTDAMLVRDGFYETEIGRRVERFGNVAQVRSAYQMRRTADGPLIGRGVNYLQLYWDGTRWWIAGAVWDDERPGNPIPADWQGDAGP